MKNEQSQSNAGLYAVIILSALVLGLLIFAGFAIFGSRSQSGTSTLSYTNSTIRLNSLVISASGTVTNKSTQATVYVDINGTGQTNQLAVQNLSNTLQSFNSTALKYINGNLSRISTSYFNTNKLYNKSGYEAQESLSVIIPNVNNVSSFIGAISTIPNAYVVGAASTLSAAQISSMRTSALTLALANATSQAQALVGKNNTIYSTNISVNSYNVYPFSYAVGAVGGGGANAAATPITTTITPQFYGSTGQVTESVSVTFLWGPKK